MDFLDQIASLFSDFANPKKRVFVGYLGVSFLIAIAWLVFIKKTTLKKALFRTFDRKVFFSGSAIADYKIFVINRLFTGFISPLLLTQLAIATAVYMTLVRSDALLWGAFEDVSKPLVIALFSVVMFVTDDFTKYLVHRWMHHWPVLWSIHKVHHSAKTLTPVTVYRVHPLEGILYASRSTVAQGTVIALFYYLFGDTIDLYTVLGVNVLVFIFHVTGSNLRHSHIDIRYPKWIEHFLISPAQHQLHHSVAEEHYDKNFGAALAVWDWIFGSLHLSEGQKELSFGLDPKESQSSVDLVSIYFAPFREIARTTTSSAAKLKRRLRKSLADLRPRSIGNEAGGRREENG